MPYQNDFCDKKMLLLGIINMMKSRLLSDAVFLMPTFLPLFLFKDEVNCICGGYRVL
jgi:hypothetical protein